MLNKVHFKRDICEIIAVNLVQTMVCHHILIVKIAPGALRFFTYQFLLYKKGPPDLKDLATSRFQISMQDTDVRFFLYPRS
jgi:hypothetical protein